MALADFPRYPLLFGPSPVHPLDRLSRTPRRRHASGPSARTATAASPSAATRPASSSTSSPTRSRRAPTRWCRSAAIQSNHTRQVAAVAAKLGLKARLVQESWVDWPDAVNDRVGNILLSRIMGAEVELVEAGFGIGFKDSWENALDDVRAAGGTPYAIPAGASDHRLGGLGFANWADEVQQQERRARRLLRHDHRLQRHRLHPGRDDRRLRRPGPAAPGDRHRRVGQARRDPRPGRARSPAAPPS